MIQAISTPGSGAFMLDANNTVIAVQSTNGEGFYYRAQIYINGFPFDTQGWSRTTADKAAKDMKDFYKAYFTPVFNPVFTNLLEEQSHLLRQVAIYVEEYRISNGALITTLSLPHYTIMHNIKPVEFTEYKGTQFLDMRATTMLIPPNGKIAFPFYVWADNDYCKVTLATNTGTILNEQEVLVKGKKVYLYQYDLAGAALSYNALSVTATVQLTGYDPIVLTYRLNQLPAYPCNEIAFMNNFGYYIYAYPAGEMQVQNAFTPATYDTADGNERVYEIPEEATYTINSGALRDKEKQILNMIANSHDVRLRNGNKWVSMVTAIKKQLEFKSRQNQYDESMVFTVRKGTNVANTGLIYAEGLPDIQITDFTVDGHTVVMTVVLNNGFNPPAGGIQLQLKATGATTWIVFEIGTVIVGPVTFRTNQRGQSLIRFRERNNDDNVSNQINVFLT